MLFLDPVVGLGTLLASPDSPPSGGPPANPQLCSWPSAVRQAIVPFFSFQTLSGCHRVIATEPAFPTSSANGDVFFLQAWCEGIPFLRASLSAMADMAAYVQSLTGGPHTRYFPGFPFSCPSVR